MIALSVLALAAFNLVCSGQITAGRLDRFEMTKIGPFEVTIRIDLQAGRWCEGACSETLPIKFVDAQHILLRSEERGQNDDLEELINRESGQYLFRDRAGLDVPAFMKSGKCTPAAFTGLPTQKF